MTTETVNETAAATAALASKATNYGAVTAVAGGFLADNWIGLAGLIIAFAGFLVNWYYKHQTFKRQCETAGRDGQSVVKSQQPKRNPK